MDVKTFAGQQYVVTSATGCTVTDETGKLNLTVAAGQQAVFIAISGSVTVDDEAAVVIPFDGASPAALGGGGGASVQEIDSRTTQKVDIGTLPDYECAVEIHYNTAEQEWRIRKGPYEATLITIPPQTAPDKRVFPDIQIFFQTGATVPVIHWISDYNVTEQWLAWLNTEAATTAPDFEPNMSYHLGVSYEYGHYVLGITYEEPVTIPASNE